MWTLLGETSPNNPQGQLAVASTIANRAARQGRSYQDVVADPSNGYEAWQDANARAATQKRYPVGSDAYQGAQQVLADLQSGKTDPLPYTHFDSPSVLASRGQSEPSWTKGQAGTDIAGNRFYSLPEQAGGSEPDLLSLGGSGSSGGSTAASPAAPAQSAVQVPGVAADVAKTAVAPVAADPVLDNVAADVARAKVIQNAQSGNAQWPLYDQANDVWRNKDGSIHQIGGAPVAPTRGPNGELEITVNADSNSYSPQAISAWMAAHPLDPSNTGLGTHGEGPQQTSAGRSGVGAEQGLANVLHSVEGADLAVRQSPAGFLMAGGQSVADWERADLAGGQLDRNTNELALQNSGAYQAGKFGGEVAGTLPAMLATDGAAGVGLSALRGTEAGADLLGAAPSGGSWITRAPVALAQSAGKGAFYGGEAGALTSAGSDQPLADQIAAGARSGAVLNPVLGAVGGGAKMAGKMLSPIIDPLTAAGREGILDRNLLTSTGPQTADLTEYVPGSRPTLAQATQSPPLAVTERTLKSTNPAAATAFGDLADANAAARENYASALQGDAPTVERMKAARDAQTSDLRNTAFANKTPTDPTPVVQTIDNILASPAGQRDAVTKNLTKIRNKLVQPVDMGGDQPVLQPQTDPEQLYGIRQAIGDQLSPLSEDKDARLAKSQLMQVQNALDPVIEKGAPGFQNYLDAYSQASKPIDSLEYLQSLNLHDMRGNMTLGKVNQAVTQMEGDRAEPGLNAAKSLSDDQVQALYNLRSDLRRADTTVPLGKAARTANVTGNLDNEGFVSQVVGPLTSHVVGAMHPAAGFAMGVGRLALEGKRNQVTNLLVDRLLNPDEAKAPLNVPPVASEAGNFGWRSPLLAGVGVNVAHRPNPLLAVRPPTRP